MATITQIQKGFATFIDRHVAGAFSGWQKAVIVGGATLIAANLPKTIAMYSGHPLVSAIGIYNADSGVVDIDTLYQAIVPHLGADKIPLVIPKIGAIKFGKEEIDALMKYIKEA